MAARRSATGDVLPRTFAADVPPRTFAAAPGSPRARKHEEDCLELASHDDAMPVALLGAAATHGPSRAEACMAVADAAKEKGRSGRLSRFGRYSFSDAASDGGNLCVRCCAPVAALSRQAKVFLALICITAAGLGVGLPLGLASKTGVTVQLLTPTPPPVQYTLTITRDATGHLLMNGQFPGPVLSVEVGQTIEVTVVNNLANETTSVHWHGMFMQGTPWADGVPGVTQCPIPAANPHAGAGANTMLYSFTSLRAGTFWYHGHWNEQYVDGLYGPLIVTSADDSAAAAAGSVDGAAPVDDWVFALADWYDARARDLLPGYLSPDSDGDEPLPDAYVVNGKRSTQLNMSAARNGGPVRLRLVNTAVFSMFNVSIDGLPLTLVEVDGAAVQPLDLPYVVLNVAQRVSVILDFRRLHPDVAPSTALYIRVDGMPSMYPTYDEDDSDLGLNTTSGGVLDIHWTGLIHFLLEGDQRGLPSYGAPPVLDLARPVETNLIAARPVSAVRAPEATHNIYFEVVFRADDFGVNRAFVNNATNPGISSVFLAAPMLFPYLTADGGPLFESLSLNRTLPGSASQPWIIPLNAVVEVLINNTDTGEHPFHLHGHDFWVVSTSDAPGAAALYAHNYVRRDIVSVPAAGWARIRFVADNPGIWLVHCHIDWHMSAGFVAIFFIAPSALRERAASGELVLPSSVLKTCSNYVASVDT